MSEVWEIPVVFPFRWYWEARISSGQQLFCAIRRFIVLAQGLTAFLTAPAHLASYLEAASTSHSAFTHSLFVNGPWLAVDQCRTGVIYYLATFLNKKKKFRFVIHLPRQVVTVFVTSILLNEYSLEKKHGKSLTDEQFFWHLRVFISFLTFKCRFSFLQYT